MLSGCQFVVEGVELRTVADVLLDLEHVRQNTTKTKKRFFELRIQLSRHFDHRKDYQTAELVACQ